MLKDVCGLTWAAPKLLLSSDDCKSTTPRNSYDVSQWPIKATIYYFPGGNDPAVDYHFQQRHHFEMETHASRFFTTLPRGGHDLIGETLGDCSDKIWKSILHEGANFTDVLLRCNDKSTVEILRAGEISVSLKGISIIGVVVTAFSVAAMADFTNGADGRLQVALAAASVPGACVQVQVGGSSTSFTTTPSDSFDHTLSDLCIQTDVQINRLVTNLEVSLPQIALEINHLNVNSSTTLEEIADPVRIALAVDVTN